MPNRIVRIRFTTCPRREPTCAARTDSTMVRLLQMRTAVFKAPSGTSSAALPSSQACGYIVR